LTALILPLIITPVAHAQEEQNAAGGNSDYLLDAPVAQGATAIQDGPGLQFRGGYNAFRTFGREDSITHVELFPYVLADQEMLFGDIRGFMNTEGNFGANIGFGYRIRPWGMNRVFGASLWYDVDDSLGVAYQDVGLSLENYGDVMDLRFNAYVPVGDTEQVFTDRLTNPRFVGNDLLFDRVEGIGQALGGIDYEIGFLLPSDRLQDHNLRWYVGGYHFAGDGVDPIHGFKTRLQGTITPSIETQAEFTTDREFGSNVMLGIAWTYFGKFKVSRNKPNYDRMSEFVRRNYNVIVAQRKEVTVGVQALNPLNGLPFVVQHVGPGGNSSGTPEDPWGTIADAQAAGANVIVVHAGAVLTEGIVLEDGQVLLGEGDGVQNFLEIQDYGSVLLPRASSGAERPLIQGVTGDAVTLASNTIFSGFNIESASGHGIVGVGVSNVHVSSVNIDGTGGDGVFLQNASGAIDVLGVNISDALGGAFHVDGGSANLRFDGDIINSDGRALVVKNTTGGLVDFTGSKILDDGGEGILIEEADGDVILDEISVKNSSGHGIEIRGGDGGVAVRHKTLIKNAAGTGVLIEDTEGTVLFNELEVEGATGQNGVQIVNSPGDNLIFKLKVTTEDGTALSALDSGSLTVVEGNLDANGGTAVDIEGTDINIGLKTVFSDGAPVGIRLVDAEGVFAVAGVAALGSGGKIEGAGTGVLLDNVGVVSLAFVDVLDNGVGVHATGVDQLVMNSVQVKDSTSFGADLMNVRVLSVFNSNIAGNGAAGESGLRYRVDTTGDYALAIMRSTIDSPTGDGLRIETFGGGTGASLNLVLGQNLFKTHAAAASGARVAWNGVLVANMTNNGFETNGDDSFGFNVAALSTGSQSQITMGANVFVANGDEVTAMRVTTAGPSQIVVGENDVTFEGSGGTGMDFSLAQSALVSIFGNEIVDHEFGATGILFSSIAGPSTVSIENNTVNLQGPPAFIDRGIIFESVTGTILLQGNGNNGISNATTPFFAPAGSTTGKIRVNGALVP
jgi:hypothetical protein